jgi:sugar (pentulose or hexulose) kinase
MGAHSDMWNPRALKWSSMVERLGWERKLAPLRPAFDRLGAIKSALAKKLGLDPGTSVQCGIHDSSASLLPHLKQRTPPFAVVSTGTWVILFAAGGDIGRLDPNRDSLANVSAFGDPIACARFMGGREFERLTGGDATTPGEADLNRVLGERIMALPTFVAGCGPFPNGKGRWSHDPATLSPAERNAAASLYLALMTAESLMLAGASGPTIVEGPFARNVIFCSALATITGRPVEPSDTGTGTLIGALMTVTGRLPTRASASNAIESLGNPALGAYVAEWRKLARAD